MILILAPDWHYTSRYVYIQPVCSRRGSEKGIYRDWKLLKMRNIMEEVREAIMLIACNTSSQSSGKPMIFRGDNYDQYS